jgi:hypothetical protein
MGPNPGTSDAPRTAQEWAVRRISDRFGGQRVRGHHVWDAHSLRGETPQDARVARRIPCKDHCRHLWEVKELFLNRHRTYHYSIALP